MPTLRFEGYSDDTFGEVAHFHEDYDNCASGQPIEYLVAHRESGMGLIVTGQHCPGNSGSWLIGVANWDPDACNTSFPRWPMRIEAQDYRNGFQPSLVIEAPDGVTIKCLQQHAISRANGITGESRDDAKPPVARRVECCSCGWTGTEDEQKRVISPSLRKLGVDGWDHVCPKCERDEFYQL